MALAIPDVTLITAAGDTMTDFMTSLKSHFDSTSTKFSTVANGGDNDAFTITPVDAQETWYLNFRRTSTTNTKLLLDPLFNITDPGGTGTPPTLTDSTEDSEEQDCWAIAGASAENVDFYVIELDDALFVLNLNSGTTTHTPRGIHAGRTWIPFFTDGTNGDNYADGLGIHGHLPDWGSTNMWVGASTFSSGPSKIRGHQTGWFGPLTTFEPTSLGRINLNERVAPLVMGLDAVDGATDRQAIGFSKYMFKARVSQSPGTLMDGGVGNDAFVHIADTNASDTNVIPWDRLVSPVF
jgi:hypothetical protein